MATRAFRRQRHPGREELRVGEIGLPILSSCAVRPEVRFSTTTLEAALSAVEPSFWREFCESR
jgi:hypothetical protein